jgi:hypothetical protein
MMTRARTAGRHAAEAEPEDDDGHGPNASIDEDFFEAPEDEEENPSLDPLQK